MFTHTMVGSNDVPRSKSFYDKVLGALGIGPGHDMGHRVFYRSNDGGPAFGVGKPVNDEAATHANGGTISFAAANKEAVDAWHAAGLEAGGTCEGEPGPRPRAPGNAYGAYLRDPDGNKLCAYCQLPG